jgi:hypothetical protein
MSYDIEIFTIIKPEISLLESLQFVFQRSNAVYQGMGWQIVVNSPHRLEKEDVYSEVWDHMPGLNYRVTINLEGERTDKSLSLLNKVADSLTQTFNGLVLN